MCGWLGFKLYPSIGFEVECLINVGISSNYLFSSLQSVSNKTITIMDILLISSTNKIVKIVKSSTHHCMCGGCEGHVELLSMQPTKKHLRISHIHQVNNKRTQLSYISRTLDIVQMHCSTSNNFICCKMTLLQVFKLVFFFYHDWVTPSRILLLFNIP